MTTQEAAPGGLLDVIRDLVDQLLGRPERLVTQPARRGGGRRDTPAGAEAPFVRRATPPGDAAMTGRVPVVPMPIGVLPFRPDGRSPGHAPVGAAAAAPMMVATPTRADRP